MTTSFRPYVPEQAFLLPPSLKEWLPSGHLSHFVSDMVEQLDLGPFYSRYGGDGRRRQPFDPPMIASGVSSSRKIARRIPGNIAFRMLRTNNVPAHRTIR